jgi:hypothetical protein
MSFVCGSSVDSCVVGAAVSATLDLAGHDYAVQSLAPTTLKALVTKM